MTQLAVRRLARREYEGTDWQVKAEAKTPYEVVLMPRFWAHVSASLRPCDELHVMPEDGAWYAHLLVISAGPLFANVVPISFVDIANYDAKKPKVPDGYEVAYRGEGAQWCVTLEKKDVKTGLSSENEAMALALTHAASVATPKAKGGSKQKDA